jgi:hypothetical protein
MPRVNHLAPPPAKKAAKTISVVLLSLLFFVRALTLFLSFFCGRRYLSQEPVLFSATVAENISFGSNVSTAALEHLCIAIGLHAEVLKLPNGYDTKLSSCMHMSSTSPSPASPHSFDRDGNTPDDIAAFLTPSGPYM